MEKPPRLSQCLAIGLLSGFWAVITTLAPALSAQETSPQPDTRPPVAQNPPAAPTSPNPDRPSPGVRPTGDRFIRVFISRNDRNGNGVVERAEFRGSPARFDEMDANGNGHLDPEELQPLFRRRLSDPKSMRERIQEQNGPGIPASPPPRGPGLATTPDGRPISGEAIFQSLDTDGDKMLTAAEFSKSPGLESLDAAEAIVRDIDQDDDERLSWPEFNRVFQMRHGSRQNATGGYNHPSLKAMGAKGRAGASPDRLQSYERIFNRLDANRDGNMTTKEFVEDGSYLTPGARARIFRVSDTNRDGTVSREEYVENRIITDEAKAIVERADTDGDQTITRAEFLKHPALTNEITAAAIYDQLDTNGDGEIRPPEYLRVWGRWARQDIRGLGGPRRGGRSSRPPGQAGPPDAGRRGQGRTHHQERNGEPAPEAIGRKLISGPRKDLGNLSKLLF